MKIEENLHILYIEKNARLKLKDSPAYILRRRDWVRVLKNQDIHQQSQNKNRYISSFPS
jgi:hypothetical protein